MAQQLLHFFRNQIATVGGSSAAVIPNNLVWYLKDLNSSVSATSPLKLVASSLELNHKDPVISG